VGVRNETGETIMEIVTKNGHKLEIDDSQEAKEFSFKILIEWIKEHDAFSWEKMEQDDECQLYAINCLGPIVDKISKMEE